MFGGVGYDFRRMRRFALAPRADAGWIDLGGVNADCVGGESGAHGYSIPR